MIYVGNLLTEFMMIYVIDALTQYDLIEVSIETNLYPFNG